AGRQQLARARPGRAAADARRARGPALLRRRPRARVRAPLERARARTPRLRRRRAAAAPRVSRLPAGAARRDGARQARLVSMDAEALTMPRRPVRTLGSETA